MTTWWVSLSVLQQIFALFAIPATVILALQTLMLLFGLGHHGDADGGGDGGDGGDGVDAHDGDAEADHHGGHAHKGGAHDSGLRIFTVRAFVAFFSIFGWLGIVLLDGGMNTPFAITLAFIAGVAAMIGIAYFFKAAMQLQSSGNIDIRNSLGKTATVYIPIPPNRTGKGKVTLTVQDRFIEVDAVTDSDLRLKTGTEVIGISMTDQNVLCVAPVHEPPATDGK
jgi:membrane protein implicated in regulation of membrane protease activity